MERERRKNEMKNIKFYLRCVLNEGIPRKERKTEMKERKEHTCDELKRSFREIFLSFQGGF